MNASRVAGSLVWLLSLLASCATEPLSVRGSQSQTLDIAVGQELDVTLQTVGPGQYLSPPSVSSVSLRFLDVAFVSPSVPAGPTQRFRFEGEAPGQVIVVFQHSGNDPTITYTVDVH